MTRDSLASGGKLQALLVNSGNANACIGRQGLADAYEMRSAMAEALGVPAALVGVASTGIIGELLPMEKVRGGIARMPRQLSADGCDFSQAILTTDLVQKSVCVRLEIAGKTVHIAGTAKGSGMIHPNMATMLGFITTDARIGSGQLQSLLGQTTDSTFNMITVDGDTSTNDMVVVLASGLAGHDPLHPGHSDWSVFAEAFCYVAQYLAKAIARDGEGAAKLIGVNVRGALSNRSAGIIAKTVVGSSLVKTACYGADANWGRIIAAVGRSGEPVAADFVDIHIGEIPVLIKSAPVEVDEEKATLYLKGEEVAIYIDLHQGAGSATAWGCDLTYDYVRINASYRT
ncbi:ornithine acetyltransferase-like protein/N-acetylglutamate synthase-like protein [Paenibacillus larvae subsp. larvae B-3650]|nr:ornithine acetyltransferase-like protein/N-acetylglutamate synthase-like protein [Paenibacillus larvae subsp. larvae B-3650]